MMKAEGESNALELSGAEESTFFSFNHCLSTFHHRSSRHAEATVQPLFPHSSFLLLHDFTISSVLFQRLTIEPPSPFVIVYAPSISASTSPHLRFSVKVSPIRLLLFRNLMIMMKISGGIEESLRWNLKNRQQWHSRLFWTDL
ncbi:unnamed protein product [Vicia faba]|uniref:Uncharacterized protein n=1 Tax=Vicia faba TaxID=3906 RepID=A0AAV1AFK3_VICFA|nr:unnamed protein product [Vicia faba]